MTEGARTLSLFIHIGASVVWFGGLLMMTLLVVPELRRALAGQAALDKLLRRLRRRFMLWGNLALAALVVTGLLQMTDDPNYEGLLRFDNRWSQALLLKHGLILALAGLGAALQLGVLPALERATLLREATQKSSPRPDGGTEGGIPRPDGGTEGGLRGGTEGGLEIARLKSRERRLTWTMLALALAILAVSAWLGVL